MVYKTEQQFYKALREQPLLPVYLIYGKDDYLKERYLKIILDKALGDRQFESFNYDQIDGKKLSLEALHSSVLAPPFMAEYRAVLLDDPAVEKLTAADAKSFEEILRSAEQGTVLIVLIRRADVDTKNAKWKAVHKLCGELGGVICLDGRDRAELCRFIRQRCEAGGRSITQGLCELLLDRSTGDMQTLGNELAKLVAAGGGEVTEREILALVSPTLTAQVYDLSKAILAGDCARAMRIVDILIEAREPEVGILSALSYAFIDLYRAKVIKRENIPIADAVEALGYRGRDFRLKNAVRDAGRYKTTFLLDVLALLADTDHALKSSRTDSRVLLEQAVAEIFVLR